MRTLPYAVQSHCHRTHEQNSQPSKVLLKQKKTILLLGAMTTVDSMSTPSYSTLRPVVSTGIIQPTLPDAHPLTRSSTAMPPAPFPFCSFFFMPLLPLREHPAHVAADSLVVKEILDAADGRNSDILVPNLLLRKSHDIISGHSIDGTLNLAGTCATAGGDNLAANVLGQGGGAIEGQQNRSLQLGLGALGLGLGYGLRQARPLAEGEVDEIVNLLALIGDKVNTPETILNSVFSF